MLAFTREFDDLESVVSITQLQTKDAAIVTARLFNGLDLYEVTTSSRRDPVDRPNNEIGQKLALGRALRQLGRELLKEANESVRQQELARQSQLKAVAESRARRSAVAAEAKPAEKNTVKKATKKAAAKAK